MNTLWLRKTHRWLGLVVGLQLIAWTASGLYFSYFPINEVRGSHLRANSQTALNTQQLSQTDLTQALSQLPKDYQLLSLNAQMRLDQAVWFARIQHQEQSKLVVIDAMSSQILPAIDADQAKTLALKYFKGEAKIKAVNYLERVELDSEYRGKELPAYQVQFDHDSGAHFYIGAQSGQLTAVRTDIWRGFDFLWMLHIMDYQEREDFNHGLLQILSVLALLTVISGLWLWAAGSSLFRSSKPSLNSP